MLNDASDVEGTSDASWIILILDARTQQILAPSIDIDELRSRGVVDRLVNFISLEEDLFSLGLESSFTIMSKAIANLHDESVMKLVEDCSNGLLSVAVTFGSFIPFLLPRNGESRHLAATMRVICICQSFGPTPSIENSGLLFECKESAAKNTDLISPLRHKWSYGALVHDFFPVRLNRILSLGKEESAQLLLSWKDPIWKHASRLSFPDACTLFGDELQTYQKAYAQISGGDGDEIEPLRKALEEIPALREKKHWIDTHLLLASALLPQISQRRPDLFRELETAQPSANISLPELDPIDEGDRIRLLLVVFLSSGKDQRLLPFLIEKFSLKESASLAKALHAIVPEFTMASSLSDSTSPNATPNDIPEQKVSIFETLSTSGNVVASSRIAKMVMQGIQRISNQVLSPSGDDDALMPIIRYVDAALRGEGESRMPVTAGSSMLPKRLVVFVVGGIAYDEYQSLSAFLARNWPGIEVAIGGTSLCSSSDFLAQLYQTGGRDSETHPNATCS
ncbi:hypothetical protein DI09_8p250 [Mitosporidium daphniae]|uniref:Sec1 family protein n=1 Tax=Mitosporidium daphniae TaxID=1485682 RepID=A0A098VQR7_9MICR|nr:uncharacterized protein DI09_8p250 [Mitosporidium daphniae]KGG50086.1 hypothetical protein DI09_8p250 [Mitosporidium daphniae]|eukprot:XP_013236513.1 uncharacterized protein DI09_8p250 [Mitosporidium daphniae]